MAKLSMTPYPGNWDINSDEGFADTVARHGEQFKKIMDAQPTSDSVSLIGAMINFPVGDGYAYYVVTEDQPLTVAWVPCFDAWQVDECTIRGIYSDYVRHILMRREALR